MRRATSIVLAVLSVAAAAYGEEAFYGLFEWPVFGGAVDWISPYSVARPREVLFGLIVASGAMTAVIAAAARRRSAAVLAAATVTCWWLAMAAKRGNPGIVAMEYPLLKHRHPPIPAQGLIALSASVILLLAAAALAVRSDRRLPTN